MKNFKLMIAAITTAVVWACAMVSIEALAASDIPLFKDYQAAGVRPFEVTQATTAPASEGRTLADEIVIQIGRYNAKFNLFEMVILEGAQKLPADKKVLPVKGTITAYAPNNTCAVHCQFVDKATG